MPRRRERVAVVGKLIRARIREARIEPAEPVQLPPDGTEVFVSVEEASRANEWFRELHALFAPVRARLATASEEAIDHGDKDALRNWRDPPRPDVKASEAG